MLSEYETSSKHILPISQNTSKAIPSSSSSIRKSPSLGSLRAIPSHPTSDQDVIELMFARHTSMVSILKNRLSSLRAVRNAWDEGFVSSSSSSASSSVVKPAIETVKKKQEE